jgi:hypothetical protein
MNQKGRESEREVKNFMEHLTNRRHCMQKIKLLKLFEDKVSRERK